MKIVIAIGGNALGNSPEEQLQLALSVAKPILRLIQQGHQVVLVHGNGPQVGLIKTSLDLGHAQLEKIPFVNLNHAGAMSQGYIGYAIQQACRNMARKMNLAIEPVTIVTQVVVDQEDLAFKNPTKPIGGFYTQQEAEKMRAEGLTMVEDAGRGYRQVVASPRPQSIVEYQVIQHCVDQKMLVIAAGGGGIPVILTKDGYEGIDAVIDKDFASSKLADLIQADQLILLTGVPRVMIHYGTPQAESLSSISIEEAQHYINEGHFAPGSMLPKVQAAMEFVRNHPERRATIGLLQEAELIIKGESGTTLTI